MISNLIEIGTFLIGVFNKKQKIKKEKKEKLVEVFKDISELLNDTAVRIENGEYPHGNCAAMSALSSEITKMLDGILPKEEVDRISNELQESSRLELEYHYKDNPQTIISLYNAAGLFKALSIINKL